MAHGSHGMMRGGVVVERPRHGLRTLRRLLSYLGADRRLMWFAAVLVVAGIGFNLWGSYMLRPIINDYIMPGDLGGLARRLALLAAVYLGGVFCTVAQYRLLNRVGQRAVARLRVDLFAHMEHLPLQYFDTHEYGDLMSRYTNDIDRIGDALTDSLADILSSALTVAGAVIMMSVISLPLSLAVLVMVPLMWLGARLVVSRSRKYFGAQQAALGNVNGYVEEMVSGQKVVKLFGHEAHAMAGFEALNRDLDAKSRRAQFYSGMMMPFMQGLNTLNYVVVTILGGLLVIAGMFDVGGLAAFLQYSRQFGRPINDLASLYNNLQSAIAGAERVFGVIDRDSEPADPAAALELEHIRGDVELRDVWFEYERHRPVLKGVSLRVDAGCKIALVGTTGAGKTTVMNLLPRFYDILRGEILIDGHPIETIRRAALRRSMATVLQDTHLFTGTVRENIRFGRLEATDNEVVAAAKLTAAHSFIRRLPNGYDTMLENDGANLSQGQRQLLNIARAAVANPAILLLDEATSNIDTRSEILIQRGLDKLMEGRTSIVIAHRLSTVRNAHHIVVLENGTVIEHGTHDQLLKKRGKYARLYHADASDF